MKTTHLLFSATLLAATIAKAQLQPMGSGMQPMGNGASPTSYVWTTDLYSVQSGINANLGTQSSDPFNIFTNGQQRVEIDALGNLKILGLANNTLSPTSDNRLLYIDINGNITTSQKMKPPVDDDCVSGSTPWYAGGNSFGYQGGQSLIGPCEAIDFVMQSNSKKSIFLTTDGRVNIGPDNDFNNYATTAAEFDVSSTELNGNNQRNHLRIYGNKDGAIEATNNMHLYFEDNSSFKISRGSPSGVFADMIEMNASSGISLNDNTTIAGDTRIYGKTMIGGQTQTGIHSNALLTVNGKIVGREMIVTLSNWADYVFNKDYTLQSLESVEDYIAKNKHLPNVPSAKEIEGHGADLGELLKVQMEKIEELTLYMIDLKKESEALKAELDVLKKSKN